MRMVTGRSRETTVVRNAGARKDFVTHLGSLGETVLDWATWLGLLVVGAVLVYIVGGVITGAIFKAPASEIERLTETFRGVTGYLMIAAVGVAFIVNVRSREHQAEWGGGVVALALLLWFGFPALVGYQQPSGEKLAPPLIIAIQAFADTGRYMLLSLVVPLLRYLYRSVRSSPLKVKQETEVAKAKLRREPPKEAKPSLRPTVLSPCWHLPYCRDYLVQMCPAFKARSRCWKFGGGCFCDQQMIEAMLTGVTRGPRRSDAAYMESEIGARTGIAKQRRTRPPCGKCFIYQEHEKLKHEVMSPLCYPTAAAITFFAYEPFIRPIWLGLQSWVTGLWARLAFQKVSQTPEEIASVFGMETATQMFAILCGLYLLLGLLRLCEMWCFKWKL